MSDFKEYVIVGAIILVTTFVGFWLFELLWVAGSTISTGTGTYTGIIVETREHGIFWTTKGAHFKTGENSSEFEDFCVTDNDIFNELAHVKPDAKIKVMYRKILTSPSWQCDALDSSDIIVNFTVLED